MVDYDEPLWEYRNKYIWNGDKKIAYCESPANAELIIKSVKAYDKLKSENTSLWQIGNRLITALDMGKFEHQCIEEARQSLKELKGVN